jgi:tungstate transport system ATP-binding protein
MMEEKPLYRISGLRFHYGDTFELSIPGMEIAEGESIGLVGPNGGGKSTLLKLLAFLETPQEGSIVFLGKSVQGSGASVARNVTILLQEPYLLKTSIFENVAYGLRVRGEKERIRERVEKALWQVGLPFSEFAHRKWHQLSGGEAQRVALASRLILNPKALLLDEPTASIDSYSTYRIRQAIVDIRKSLRMALIVASHDLEWLNGAVDRIYKIHDGRIIGSGEENLIPGPWEPCGNDLWRKVLEGGQSIVAAGSPPGRESAALLRGSDVEVHVAEWEERSVENILPATVTGMFSGMRGKSLTVQVDLGGLTLQAMMSPERADHLRVLPGRRVWVAFPAAALRWLQIR